MYLVIVNTMVLNVMVGKSCQENNITLTLVRTSLCTCSMYDLVNLEMSQILYSLLQAFPVDLHFII